MARNRKETEARIRAAVGQILAEPGGFRILGVNAIAERAGVDKVLIYRYFGTLPELVRAWAEHADLWPTFAEVAGEGGADDDLAGALAVLLRGYLAALRNRPATQGAFAWEACEAGPLAPKLEALRDAWGREVTERVFRRHKVPAKVDIQAVMAILAAAADHFALLARHVARYNGIDLQTAEGRARIDEAYAAILTGVIGYARDGKRRA